MLRRLLPALAALLACALAGCASLREPAEITAANRRAENEGVGFRFRPGPDGQPERYFLPPGSFPARFAEPWQFPEDGAGWKLGDQGSDATGDSREYVAGAETMDQWSRRLTSTNVFNAGSVDQLYTAFARAVVRECPQAVLQLAERTPERIILSWRHAGCGTTPPRHEVRRFEVKAGRAAMLAYTRTVPQMPDSELATALQFVAGARLR